jgi:transposase
VGGAPPEEVLGVLSSASTEQPFEAAENRMLLQIANFGYAPCGEPQYTAVGRFAKRAQNVSLQQHREISMTRPSKYDTATQQRAVRMYFERLEDGDISKAAARREIGELLGVKESTLRNWIRKQEQQEQAPQSGSLSYEQLHAAYEEQAKEVAKLRRANDILKTASAFFAQAELDRKLR